MNRPVNCSNGICREGGSFSEEIEWQCVTVEKPENKSKEELSWQ